MRIILAAVGTLGSVDLAEPTDRKRTYLEGSRRLGPRHLRSPTGCDGDRIYYDRFGGLLVLSYRY